MLVLMDSLLPAFAAQVLQTLSWPPFSWSEALPIIGMLLLVLLVLSVNEHTRAVRTLSQSIAQLAAAHQPAAAAAAAEAQQHEHP